MKTKYKITNGLFLVVLFAIFNPLKAQTDATGKKKLCDGLMNAPYIFEGKLDSSKYFTVKTGQYSYANYTAYLVEVDKVFKGNIQKGTIEIVQYADGYTYKGPDHWESSQSSEGRPGLPGSGIYFCFDTTSSRMASYFKNSNSKTLRQFDGIALVNGDLKKDKHDILNLYFSSLSDFSAYISANYGIDVSTK